MSRPSRPRQPSTPTAALDALMAAPAGDPIRRALWLDDLDRRFHPLLPAALAPHVRLANYQRGRLVFLVDAPVWRPTLRLLAPRLLDPARPLRLDARAGVGRPRHAPPARPTPPRNHLQLSHPPR